MSERGDLVRGAWCVNHSASDSGSFTHHAPRTTQQ